VAFWKVFSSAVERQAYSLEAIETHYCRSAYVNEVCVLHVTDGDSDANPRLHAVVVPNTLLTRSRRIANVGDLLRFEIEGLSIQLPAEYRVAGYELWFEPLPRTPTGEICRRTIEQRVRRNPASLAARRAAAESHRWKDAHAERVVECLRRRAPGAAILPESNLELDLSLDSIGRVELIADLEERFGLRVREAQTHEVLTVQDLIEAVRPSQASSAQAAADGATEQAWTVLLRDLPHESDPVLSQLLVRRRLVPVVLFAVLRVLRMVMPRIEADGLQHLPPNGPYILAPNHQSYLDPFFVCSVVRLATLRQLFFVGASEYFSTAVTAWLARQCNLIAVDPDANLVPAMRAAAFGLKHGKILMLFPEGERSVDGRVKRFKKGAPILSRQLRVPIVPVAISGAFQVWPRTRAFNWRLMIPGRGHRVRITFGVPLMAEEQGSDGDTAVALRETVLRMWEQQTIEDGSSATRRRT
jgi:long-chain acyl-CoA synthetase